MSHAAAEEAMLPKVHNVAIVGYGMSATVFHIPLIDAVPHFSLYAIVQRTPRLGHDAKNDHPGVRIYRSLQETVNDGAVDVVVITTSPDSHYQLAKLALESEKHVVVEKPFTPTFAEAEELISVAKRKQRLLTVYQNRRWDTDFLTLSQLIDKNALGRIVEFETHFDRYRPEAASGGWKTKILPGGGAIYDLGTHLIDQVVVKFGLPKRITGFIGTQRQNNTDGFEDSCTVLLHYGNMLATVKVAVVSLETEQLRFWVRGEKASYKKYHLDCQEDQLKAGKGPKDDGFGVEPNERGGTLTTFQNGQPWKETWINLKPLTYMAFYSEFAKALSGKGEVPVKPKDASAVIRLIELARRSSAEGRTLDV